MCSEEIKISPECVPRLCAEAVFRGCVPRLCPGRVLAVFCLWHEGSCRAAEWDVKADNRIVAPHNKPAADDTSRKEALDGVLGLGEAVSHCTLQCSKCFKGCGQFRMEYASENRKQT